MLVVSVKIGFKRVVFKEVSEPNGIRGLGAIDYLVDVFGEVKVELVDVLVFDLLGREVVKLWILPV